MTDSGPDIIYDEHVASGGPLQVRRVRHQASFCARPLVSKFVIDSLHDSAFRLC